MKRYNATVEYDGYVISVVGVNEEAFLLWCKDISTLPTNASYHQMIVRFIQSFDSDF